jgi:hypothetical protein
MIPTIRSMIVAILLTVVALSGAFGVFATFRVNHQPARLSAAALPLRLVANDATVPATTDGMGPSFGSRFQVSEALIAGAVAGMSARNPDQPDADAAPGAVADVGPAADNGEASQPATAPMATDAAAIEPPNDPAQRAQAAAEMPNDQAQLAQAATEMPDDQAQPVQAATETPNDQAAPVQAVAEPPQPRTAVQIAAAPTTPTEHQDTAREIANRKRIAAQRRARRARATAVAQSANPNTAFPQPGFQSAPQAVGGPFVSPPVAKPNKN